MQNERPAAQPPADDTADVGALDGTDGTDRTDRTDGEFDRKLGRWAWIAIAAFSGVFIWFAFRDSVADSEDAIGSFPPGQASTVGCGPAPQPAPVSDVSTPTTASVTGVRVLIGAGTELDLDSGTVVASSVSVGDREWVSELRQIGEITYVVVRDCDIDTVRVLSVDGSGSAEPLRPPLAPGEEWGWLVDAGGTAHVAVLPNSVDSIEYRSLRDGSPISLPPDFDPYRWGSEWIDGIQFTNGFASTALTRVSRISGEAQTVQPLSGAGIRILFSDDDHLVWTDEPTGDGPQAMSIHRWDSGETNAVPTPLPAATEGRTLSANGRYLVVYDAPWLTEAPLPSVPTANYRVLDLDTGQLMPIPGLAGLTLQDGAVQMVFDEESSRLVLSFPADGGTRFASWLPGSDHLDHSPALIPWTTMRHSWVVARRV